MMLYRVGDGADGGSYMIHLMCSDPASSISGTYILNGIYASAFTPGVSNFFL